MIYSIWQVRVLMTLLAVVIAIRPGWGEDDSHRTPVGSDLELLLVVDRTVSMSALDHAGVRSRLEGVREDLRELVEALPNSRFSLVTFGREAETVLPFTSDDDQVLFAIDELAREELLAGVGSTVDRPLEQVRAMLDRAEEQHPERRRIVVFASDGENTLAGHRQASFKPLDRLVDGGAVLAYGTASGGLMPTGGERESAFVQDLRTGDDAVSRMDEANLRKIAREMGVSFTHRRASGGLADYAKALRRGGEGADEDFPAEHELYWIFALLLVGLAVVELRYDILEVLDTRRELAT